MAINNYTLEHQLKMGENTEIIQLLSATTLDLALNGTYDLPLQKNIRGQGAIVFVKLNAEVGTAGITPSLYVLDPDGTVFLFRTEAELTASGTVAYVYYPGATTGATSVNGANINAAAAVPIPREFGIRLAKSTGDTAQTFTAEVYIQYLA